MCYRIAFVIVYAIHYLNMICTLQRTNIETVKDNFTLQLIPILLNVVVLNHDDYHVNLVEELVEVKNLVLYYLLLSEEGIKGLQRTGQVALLNV